MALQHKSNMSLQHRSTWHMHDEIIESGNILKVAPALVLAPLLALGITLVVTLGLLTVVLTVVLAIVLTLVLKGLR